MTCIEALRLFLATTISSISNVYLPKASRATTRISPNPLHTRLVCGIKFLLTLCHAISACYQKPRQDKWVSLFFGRFKLLPCLLAQTNIPGKPSFVTPMEVFGRSKDFSVQSQSFLSMGTEPRGGRFSSRHPNRWWHCGERIEKY